MSLITKKNSIAIRRERAFSRNILASSREAPRMLHARMAAHGDVACAINQRVSQQPTKFGRREENIACVSGREAAPIASARRRENELAHGVSSAPRRFG
jgi:hypothetical protein